MRGNRESHWCILRCSGAKTLPLARSLNDAGIEAWTPIEPKEGGGPRSKNKAERQIAITPTFVFARARHLGELLVIRQMPVSPHPGFSVFQRQRDRRIPLIADLDMIGFRAAEEAANVKYRKERAKDHVEPGQAFDLQKNAGAYTGLTGTIKQVGNKESIVTIFKGKDIKIDTWILAENVIRTSQSHSDTAARAA